jgi:hypothetical protein
MKPDGPRQSSTWWMPILNLVIHIVLGSLLFAIIFTPAVLLDFLIQWLKEETKISEFLATLLTGAKIALALIDTSLYFIWVFRMSWLFVRELWGYEAHE